MAGNDSVFDAIARGVDPTAAPPSGMTPQQQAAARQAAATQQITGRAAAAPAPPAGNDAVFAAISKGQDPTAPSLPDFAQKVRARLGDQTFGQVDQIFRNAGISTFAWTHNANRESGGNTGAVGDNGSSFGLFQLHRGGMLDQYGLTPQQAQDPLIAAKVMAAEARKQGVHTVTDPRRQALEFTRRVERPASDVVLQVMQQLGQPIPHFPNEGKPGRQIRPTYDPYAHAGAAPAAPQPTQTATGAPAQQQWDQNALTPAEQQQGGVRAAKPAGRPPTMDDYLAIYGPRSINAAAVEPRHPPAGPETFVKQVVGVLGSFAPGVGAQQQQVQQTDDLYGGLAMRGLAPRPPQITDPDQLQRLNAIQSLLDGFDKHNGSVLRTLQGAAEGAGQYIAGQLSGSTAAQPGRKVYAADQKAVAARYAQAAKVYDWQNLGDYIKRYGESSGITALSPWDKQVLTAALSARKLALLGQAATDQRVGVDVSNYVIGAIVGGAVAAKALPYLATLEGPVGSRIAAMAQQAMTKQTTLGGRALQAVNPLAAISPVVAQEVMAQPKSPQEAATAAAVGYGFHAAHGLTTAPFAKAPAPGGIPSQDALLQAVAESKPGDTLETVVAAAKAKAPAEPAQPAGAAGLDAEEAAIRARIQARQAARAPAAPPAETAAPAAETPAPAPAPAKGKDRAKGQKAAAAPAPAETVSAPDAIPATAPVAQEPAAAPVAEAAPATGRRVTMQVNGESRSADLTPEQAAQWDAVEAAQKQHQAFLDWHLRTGLLTAQEHAARTKGSAMDASAQKRQISGLLTAKEQAAADAAAKTLIPDRPVIVTLDDGSTARGTVTQRPTFGKVPVRLEDGSTVRVGAAQVEVRAPEPQGAAPAPETAPGATEAKQPWEMTQAEWDEAFRQARANPEGTGGDTALGGMGRATGKKGLAARADAAQARRDFLKMGLPDRDVGDGMKAPARHYQVVEEALRRGYPVPPEVLKDYPDLSPSAAAAPPPIPPKLRDAIRAVNRPNVPDDVRAEAQKVVDRNQALAEKKGWDWPAVVERVRTDAGLDEQWRTPDEARNAKRAGVQPVATNTLSDAPSTQEPTAPGAAGRPAAGAGGEPAGGPEQAVAGGEGQAGAGDRAAELRPTVTSKGGIKAPGRRPLSYQDSADVVGLHDAYHRGDVAAFLNDLGPERADRALSHWQNLEEAGHLPAAVRAHKDWFAEAQAAAEERGDREAAAEQRKAEAAGSARSGRPFVREAASQGTHHTGVHEGRPYDYYDIADKYTPQEREALAAELAKTHSEEGPNGKGYYVPGAGGASGLHGLVVDLEKLPGSAYRPEVTEANLNRSAAKFLQGEQTTADAIQNSITKLGRGATAKGIVDHLAAQGLPTEKAAKAIAALEQTRRIFHEGSGKAKIYRLGAGASASEAGEFKLQGTGPAPPAPESGDLFAEPAKPTLSEKAAPALDAAEAKIKARLKSRRGRVNMGVDPEDLADYGALAAIKLARGTVKFADWSREMLAAGKEFGHDLSEHLPALWAKAREHYERTLQPKYGLDALDAESGTAFKTAKGSTYTAYEDGTTVRNKALRADAGHEGDQGIKPRSSYTVYVTPEQAQALSLLQTKGVATMLERRGEHVAVKFLDGPNVGKYAKGTGLKTESAPRVGLQPVEVWDRPGKPQSVHFGNEITEVTGTPPAGGKAVSEAVSREKSAQTAPPAPKTAPSAEPSQYAGSINLDKLAVPEADKQLLRGFVAEHAGEIQAQRRGVRSHAATEAAANQLVKAGLVPEGGPGKALNAEESLAVGKLHVRLLRDVRAAEKAYQQDASPENLAALMGATSKFQATHFATQGAAAEAGRALNIYRKVRTAYQGVIGTPAETFDRATNPDKAPAAAAPDRPEFGATNRLFKREAALAARDRLVSKAFRSHALFDPTALPDLLEYSGYLMEGGLRQFGSWAKQMKADFAHLTDEQVKDLWARTRAAAKKRAVEATPPKELARQKLLDIFGEEGLSEDVIKRLAAIPDNDSVAMARLLRDQVKFRPVDVLDALHVSSTLSDPTLPPRKFIGNALFAAMQIPERVVRGGLTDPVMAKLEGRPREYFVREAPALAYGYLRGIPEGVRDAAAVLKNGLTAEAAERLDMPRYYEFPGGYKNPLNIPARNVQAVSAFWMKVAQSAERHAGAVRTALQEGARGDALTERANQLVQHPTDAMLEAEDKFLRFTTFKGESGKTDLLLKAMYAARNIGTFPEGYGKLEGLRPMAFVARYVRTPYEMWKAGMKFSPLGLADLPAKDAKRAVVLSRALTGSAFMATLAGYASAGLVTGATPRDAGGRKQFYDDGFQPFSVKVGHRWVSYAHLGALTAPIVQVAATYDAFRRTDGVVPQRVFEGVVSGAGEAFLRADTLDAWKSLQDAVEEPEKAGQAFAARTASSAVPFSRALARAQRVTDVQRDFRTDEGSVQQIYDRIISQIPGAARKLPPFDEQRQEGGAWALLPTEVSKPTSERYLPEPRTPAGQRNAKPPTARSFYPSPRTH